MASHEITQIVDGQSGGDTFVLRDKIASDGLAEFINAGPKNFLQLTTTVASETKRGITATYDLVNGTVTLNGTHDGTGDANFYLYSGNYADQRLLPRGTYRLSGVPAGGSTTTWTIVLTALNVYDDGSTKLFTISNDTSRIAPYIRVRKPSGQTVSFNNSVFRPMICYESVYKVSAEHVPFRPSYQELYDMVKALQT